MAVNRERLLFIFLLVLHVLPIWSVQYFPSQDGPSHVGNAVVLREYNEPHISIFRKYYRMNERPVPNWITHGLLAGLLYVASPLTAEKIVLSVYLLLLPVSLRFALSQIHPESRTMSILVFPFLYNYLLHKGLYNFCYSIVLYFFVLGYWMKHLKNFGAKQAIVLAALAVALYFSHLSSLLLACLAIFFLAIWFTSVELLSKENHGAANTVVNRKAIISRLFLPLLSLLPALLLAVAFLLPEEKRVLGNQSVGVLLSNLWHLQPLVSFTEREIWLALFVVFLFVLILTKSILFKFFHRNWNRWDGFLVLSLCYFILYFFLPRRTTEGGMINDRMALFFLLTLILWFGAQTYKAWFMHGMRTIAVVLSLLFLVSHFVVYRALQDPMQEFLSGIDLIEPNTTLLPLCFSPDVPAGWKMFSKVKMFRHTSGYIAAHRRVVVMDNYEGNRNSFPIQFREELNPYRFLGGIEDVPPQVRLDSYEKRTGEKIDYVLVWKFSETFRGNPNVKSISEQLREEYKLIHRSDNGLMQLYRLSAKK
ncbi:hypothetical protein L0222_18185 [bacterium]|nr:hypothetical protein [bacterium]